MSANEQTDYLMHSNSVLGDNLDVGDHEDQLVISGHCKRGSADSGKEKLAVRSEPDLNARLKEPIDHHRWRPIRLMFSRGANVIMSGLGLEKGRSKKKFTTSVVLVTKQMALASANEIDKLPKEHIRRLARVVLGNDCRGDSPYVGIREYTYHPDFFKDKVNALAMIQLETDHIAFKLHPICGPPVNFQNETFYTMMLADDCKKGEVWVYKMIYVPFDKCKHYYRKSGLDFDSLWPSHTTCAQSVMGDECVWRSGAILVTKVDQRWRLLGFGVYGPGCQAPARFLDYGMYHKWVKDSFRNIGRTAVSTIAENHLVMRRRVLPHEPRARTRRRRAAYWLALAPASLLMVALRRVQRAIWRILRAFASISGGDACDDVEAHGTITSGAGSGFESAPTLTSRLRDVAASAHAAHEEEPLCCSKLVVLFSIFTLSKTLPLVGDSGQETSAGLRSASTGSSPPDQNQTRAYGV
ncbi:unnamed protein product [Spodoptera exigua]|nr:unnamed protein product [Spodoptera exigua]